MPSQELNVAALGGNLLDQIFAIETMEMNKIGLGLSQRSKSIKPLVPKSNTRKSVEEMKKAER